MKTVTYKATRIKSAYSGTSLAYPKDMEEEDCDMEDDAKRVIVLRYKCQ